MTDKNFALIFIRLHANIDIDKTALGVDLKYSDNFSAPTNNHRNNFLLNKISIVVVYDKSTLVGYFMQNPVYIYIYIYIYREREIEK